MLRNNADAHISSLGYLWAYGPVLAVSYVGSASFAVVLGDIGCDVIYQFVLGFKPPRELAKLVVRKPKTALDV